MHDGGEGQVLFQSGVEGVHWQQSGNNIDPLPTISKACRGFPQGMDHALAGPSPR